MRISAVAFLMILTTVFLSGCQQQHQAQVENRAMNYYSRTGVTQAALPAYHGAFPTDAAGLTQATHNDAAVTQVASRDLSAPARSSKPFAATSRSPLHATASTAWQWPVQGKVIQNFGRQTNGTSNQGITIAAAAGTPIHAAQSGEVAFVGHDMRDYGNMVILRHGNGDLTSYAHARDITVRKGDKVAAGSVLGYVGTSGSAKTPQLHFAVREGRQAVDPLRKLPQRVALNS